MSQAIDRKTTSWLPGWLERGLTSLLWVGLPLLLYLSLIGRWSLDRDEYHTLVDSTKPVSELLSYDIRPLYYLICHALWQADLGWSREFTIRLPAAIASSLIPVALWLLWPRESRAAAFYAALLALMCPWTFELSQYARYYSLMLLGSTIATLALVRWWHERHWYWVVSFVVATLVAITSHTTAAVLFPAAMGGVIAGLWHQDASHVSRICRRFGWLIAVTLCLGAALALFVMQEQFLFWLSKTSGDYGSYSVTQMYLGLFVWSGASAWCLAIVPLLVERRWQPIESLLIVFLLLALLPVTTLAALDAGGGVAVRYLMSSVPAMWVLAARHWHAIAQQLSRRSHRWVLAVVVVLVNLPFHLSTLTDGDHYDYRRAARIIDRLASPDTLVLASSPNTLELYLTASRQAIELPELSSANFRTTVDTVIERAEVEQRSLLLMIRLDRFGIVRDDQEWLATRFALLRNLETPRYDYRRNVLAIYQYRPARSGPAPVVPLPMESEMGPSAAAATQELP